MCLIQGPISSYLKGVKYLEERLFDFNWMSIFRLLPRPFQQDFLFLGAGGAIVTLSGKSHLSLSVGSSVAKVGDAGPACLPWASALDVTYMLHAFHTYCKIKRGFI